MGGKGGGDAPSPDPQIGAAALKQAQTGEQWLSFAKDSFAVSTERQKGVDALAKQVQEMQLGMAGEQFGWAKEDRARYKDIFQPIEDKFVKEASEYGSEEKQQAAAAEAVADVSQATATQRDTARREQTALGIKPGGGRWAGVERAGELGSAATSAGAANMARKQQRDKGLALQADVANLGRGLPSQAAQAASGGYTGSGSAAGIGMQNQQLSMAPTQIMSQGFQGQMGGYAGQGQLLSNLYGLNLQKWQTQQETAASGWAGVGEFLGTIGGAAIMASDRKVKKNVKAIPKGKALHAVKAMPIKNFDYKEGAGDGGKAHAGTMAQDWKKATGTGDGKTIKVQDALGITMKAVQDLDQKVDRIAAGIDSGKPPAPAPRRQSQSPASARVQIKPPKQAPPRMSRQLGLAR